MEGWTMGRPTSSMMPATPTMSLSQKPFCVGGYRTLEELLKVISWAQLDIHNEPVGSLNVDDYYNSLMAFIDKAVEDGFIQPYQRHLFVSAPDAKDLVQKLEVVTPSLADLRFLLFYDLEL
ncbi:cytokinin riboside 5'-monophosphate phosphoribohydrolase LOG1 [Canna indica]|uniref:cytokinin riboside 5'-monophosphate phosphoribohydrolase n=1 Tax=Canna indica TaxID=4628 RepID=A0AAQ3JQE1_9LILI|nr:cytokinin riboside 5'-monophosphate phosphoribohydrolase LOG1 [Canna indica]